MSRTITMEYELPHPPEKVWRALTEPALLAKWLMTSDFLPEVGRECTFRTDPMPWWDGVVKCEVLEAQPHERIRYTWRGGGLDTVVTWTLSRTPSGGTRLHLEHAGFGDDNQHAYQGALAGWQRNIDERMRQALAS